MTYDTATVRLLTENQKDALLGVFFAPASQYNPMLDGLGRWVISEEEVGETTNPDFLWVKILPQIDFVAPKFEM
jgi:hypothetical protein